MCASNKYNNVNERENLCRRKIAFGTSARKAFGCLFVACACVVWKIYRHFVDAVGGEVIRKIRKKKKEIKSKSFFFMKEEMKKIYVN